MAARVTGSLLRRLGGNRVVPALAGEPRAAGQGDGGARTGPIDPASRSVAGVVGAAARHLPPTSCLDRARIRARLLHRRGRPGRVNLGVPADPATVFDRHPAGASRSRPP